MEWAWWANKTGLWAVAFTAIAALLGVVSWVLSGWVAEAKDAELEKFQMEARNEVARLTKETADANLQAATANERAAANELKAAELLKLTESERAARIKLDQRTANRWFDPEVFKQLSAQMTAFSGQSAEVVVFPVNFESVGIAGLIEGILLSAKWKMPPAAKRLSEAPELPTQAGTLAPVMAQGVYIRASGDESSRAAGRALFDALAKTVASGVYDPAPLPGEARVFVLVGDKPTPLSVWIKDEE